MSNGTMTVRSYVWRRFMATCLCCRSSKLVQLGSTMKSPELQVSILFRSLLFLFVLASDFFLSFFHSARRPTGDLAVAENSEGV